MVIRIAASLGQKAEDAATRYRVMLGLSRNPVSSPLRVLDFGCGAAHLLEFIKANKVGNIEYSGLERRFYRKT